MLTSNHVAPDRYLGESIKYVMYRFIEGKYRSRQLRSRRGDQGEKETMKELGRDLKYYMVVKVLGTDMKQV